MSPKKTKKLDFYGIILQVQQIWHSVSSTHMQLILEKLLIHAQISEVFGTKHLHNQLVDMKNIVDNGK